MRLRRLSLFALSLLATACPSSTKPPEPAPSSKDEPREEEKIVVRPSVSGLGFRLTELEAGTGNPNKLAKTSPLSDDAANALFARLPRFEAQPGDEKEFALRDKSQPPPRTGKTVQQPFPPPVSRPPANPVAQGPLKVLRHLPEGDVSIAPHLSVTFSQPMVPVTSHGDLAGKPSPVKLSPTPPGRWRWIGTQTLLFEPEKRFPMATEFSVEVPAGTRSESGSELAAAEVWKFKTPAVRLTQSSPHGHWGQKLDVMMHLGFDQSIDAEAMLKHLQVSSGGSGPLGKVLGGTSIPVRLATAEELEKNGEARAILAKADERDRHLFLRSVEPLPKNAHIHVTLPSGAPSAEGPLRSEKTQGFDFHTFGPLNAHNATCGWRDNCAPLMPIYVHFSNQIEASKFAKSMVTVDPPIEGFKASVSHTTVTIQGRTRGKTTYKIGLSSDITDVHGQKLEGQQQFEVKVGSAEPMLFPEERSMAVLDPEATATMPLYSINQKSLRAKIYKVKPEDWDAYVKFRQDWDWEGKHHDPPGRLVENRVIQVKNQPDELVETPLDLKTALSDGVGQLIVLVEPTTPSKDRYRRESVRTWLQVTHLGLDSFSDSDQTVAWTTNLTNGTPTSGVEVSFLKGASASSGNDGLARLSGEDGSILIARKGADLAMIPGGNGSFRAYRDEEHTRWFVFDDRKTYKPGEEARIKGFLRIIKNGKGEDLGLLPAGLTISWKATDSRGVEIGKGQGVPVSGQGGFDFALALPKTPNLGSASISFELSGGPSYGRDHSHSLQIEEFRRPEFEVTMSSSEGPHQVGRAAVMTVAAKYYAGGGLPDAPVEWNVRSEQASFRPAGHTDFHFGPEPRGWWYRHNETEQIDRTERLGSQTTAQGEHQVRVDFDALSPPYPMTLHAEATVTDVNRQAWTARSTLLVHPGDHYVGVRLDRSFIRAGEPLKIDALVTDIDGRAVPKQSVEIRAARLETEQIAGAWKELEKDPQNCDLTSTEGAVPCNIKPAQAGRYRITALVSDRHGRKSQTQQTFWVYGEGMVPSHGLEEGHVRIVADRTEYKPGDQAELLLFAPFAPAEGVVTLRRQGIVHLERFTLKSQVQAIKVPIGDGTFPTIEAGVRLVGSTPRNNLAGEPDPSLPHRPAFAAETVLLPVPPDARRISVQATAREKSLEPGGSTTIDVALSDASGAPVAGAEVALAVVDEAILALGAYSLPDPLNIFYSPRSGGVVEHGTRPHVLLGRLDERSMRVQPKREPSKEKKDSFDKSSKAAEGPALPKRALAKPSATAAAQSAIDAPVDAPAPPPSPPPAEEVAQAGERTKSEGGKNKTPIAQRSNFNPLAAFIPAALSDAQGRVSVPVKLPDNLTRYRIMAVAVHDKVFGEGEGSLVARLPLMLRPSAPRFLNFGDRFDFPVVVQNQSNAPMEVDLVARASNAQFTDGIGRHFTVPANDRVEVRLPTSALKPGTARFQLGIASGNFADASTVEMPVWTPATTEAFATYGQIDDGAIAQPVKMPSGVVKEYGGLEITTSSTAVSALTDAFLYLVRYPFDCNEQIASRILSIASLRDVLTAFKSKEMPSSEALKASMKSDLNRLQGRQHWNGGFSFWGRDHEPWPYLTAHVMHSVARAKEKGYAPPPNLIAAGLNYLRSVEQHFPWYYSPESRRYITAYALYVRKRFDEADPTRARKLIEEAGGVEKMPIEALGWLLPVLHDDVKSADSIAAIMKLLANRVSETAGAAHFVTSYSDGAHVLLHSDRSADGVLLEALIGEEPKNDLIPKLVAGLLNHRKAGHWASTQENAFILLALDRYFNTYEKTTPDFVARAWLGDNFAGEQAYKGRSTDSNEIKVPMKLLSEVGEAPVTIQKDGPGRLYFRIGMQYAPEDLRPPPADHGFSVRRTYESVDEPEDVKRDPDGTWRVKVGSKVRVRVGMVASGRRYHVALVDPIPAGFEPMNPALAVTGTVPADPKKEVSPTWWWSRAWYEHQNMRDERVEAFASLLYEGVYDYSYVARATTPGSFVVPPPKAEEMYAPETFGRGAGDRVIIE